MLESSELSLNSWMIERKMKCLDPHRQGQGGPAPSAHIQVSPGHLRGLMDEQELTEQREVLGQRSAPSVYPSKVFP